MPAIAPELSGEEVEARAAVVVLEEVVVADVEVDVELVNEDMLVELDAELAEEDPPEMPLAVRLT